MIIGLTEIGKKSQYKKMQDLNEDQLDKKRKLNSSQL